MPAQRTKRAPTGRKGAGRQAGRPPKERSAEGKREQVGPDESTAGTQGRWRSSDVTGELDDGLPDAFSVADLGDGEALEEAILGEPTPPTETATETATGPEGAGEAAVESEEQLEAEEALEVEVEVHEEEEPPLDRILAQRTATWRPEEPPEEDTGGLQRQLDPETEPTVIARRQRDEFVCAACFLLKRRELLADPEHRLCRDCAA